MADNLWILIVIIFLASAAGWKQELLTFSGALAAFFVGGAIACGFGWRGLLLLGCFFVSSSLWSKFRPEAKKELDEKLMKGSQRDWQQVLANGGIAACISLYYIIEPGSHILLLFLTSIAAANSDTWASELGVLSKASPFSLLTFKPTEKGTSGAVTLFGTFCSLLGSMFIAAVSFFTFEVTIRDAVLIAFFGLLGSLYDSIIGAYIQPEYICRKCGYHTEKLVHCGEKTEKRKGWGWVDNDAVNAASIFLASLTCFMCFSIL
ncbi:DUF92 domain-containing protein [Peribacillus kribbensis]|uniref:DUF92 domain-containing protein n=1 Tax=Peribacillus kribbensis TaxID=356658 RepID=UPI0003F9B662|nr:DUF92 domain-containing protein [Peribacillus kribbensis]